MPTFDPLPGGAKADPAQFVDFETILETIACEVVVFDANGKFIYGHQPSGMLGTLRYLKQHMPLGHIYDGVKYLDENGREIPLEEYPSAKALKGIAVKAQPCQFVNTRTGEYSWYETNARPFFADEHNPRELTHIVLSYRDITKRKVQEERLKFLGEAFRALSSTMNFNLLLEHIMRLMVPTIADWATIDILNKDKTLDRVATIHQDPKKIAWVGELNALFPQDENATSGIFHVIKSGQPQFVPDITPEIIMSTVKNVDQFRALQKLQLSSIMTIPISARGNILGALSLAYAESRRHYTQQDLEFASDFCNHIGILLENAKLYQTIENENHNKEQFLAMVSHELRNPLAPIINSIELLNLKGNNNPEVQKELQVITRQFNHMTKILQDLLELGRITSGTISVKKETIDLCAVVNDVISSTKDVVEKGGYSIVSDIPHTPVVITGDPVRLTQIFINLIDNAVKFTPKGGTIWISVGMENNMAKVSVKDSGIGIRPNILPHIFDLYTKQPRQSANKLNSGLGIGLGLVRKIMELHGGTIVAKSDGVNKGTEFIIRLPLSTELPPAKNSKTTNGNGGAKSGDEVFGGFNILIADDNRDAADSLSKLFSHLGAATHIVYSASEVLSAMKRLNPNVIIMDIGMPEMDGYELATVVRKSGFKKTLIALTGYGQSEDKQKAHEAGFDHHLTKPAGIDDFKRILLSQEPSGGM